LGAFGLAIISFDSVSITESADGFTCDAGYVAVQILPRKYAGLRETAPLERRSSKVVVRDPQHGQS